MLIFKHPTIPYNTRYTPTQQFDKHYTRTNENHTFRANSHIDPILTSHDLTIAETGTLQTDARLSDHKATYISLKVDYDTRHAYKRKIWQYKDADTDKLNYLIETFDWKHLLESTNSVEIASDKFTMEYLKLVRECIPEKLSRLDQSKNLGLIRCYVNLFQYEIDFGEKRSVEIDIMTDTSINI